MRSTIQTILAMILSFQLMGASRGHAGSEKDSDLDMIRPVEISGAEVFSVPNSTSPDGEYFFRAVSAVGEDALPTLSLVRTHGGTVVGSTALGTYGPSPRRRLPTQSSFLGLHMMANISHILHAFLGAFLCSSSMGEEIPPPPKDNALSASLENAKFEQKDSSISLFSKHTSNL